MPMCKKPNGNSGNVVKGPWPDKVKTSDIDGLQVVEDLKFAEDLTEALVLQMMATFKEQGFDTSGEKFNGDIGFMIEVVKSVIYRSMGYEHPLHGFMGDILDVTETKDGETIHYETSINMELINEVSEFISVQIDNDGPELA